MSLGGGKGSSSQKGSSSGYGFNQSQSGSQQEVWGPQQAALTNLYNQAQGQFMAQKGQNIPGGQRAQQQAMNAGQPLKQFTNPNNRLVNQQIGMAQRDVGRAFNEQVLPGLTSSAIGGGGLGGSRGGIAAGLAGQEATRQMGDIASNMRMGAYNQAAQSAGQMGSLNLGGAQAGFNMGMGMFNAPWQALGNYAAAIGGPTVLGSSFGGSYGETQSQSQSSGGSNKFNLGFGFI